MARLHEASDSDDELPELSTILNAARTKPRDVQTKHPSPKKAQRTTTPSYNAKTTDGESVDSLIIAPPFPERVLKASSNDSQARIQKPLRLAHVNSLLLPTQHSHTSRGSPTKSPVKLQPIPSVLETEKSRNVRSVRDTPKRGAARKVDFRAFAEDLREALLEEEEEEGDDTEEDDLSDFIVSDDASEEELRRPRGVGRSPKKSKVKEGIGSDSESEGVYIKSKAEPVVIDLVSPDKLSATTPSHKARKQAYPQNPQEGFSPDPGATLKFSPSRFCSPRKNSNSPHKLPSTIRPLTPPTLTLPLTSPSNPRLQSPSKSTHARIPPSPHRPSLDAFWSAAEINDWNETYSPTKSHTRRRLFPLPEDTETNPSTSPSKPKSPLKSPAKKDKEALARKKQFEASKHALAEQFLKELDEAITAGQVAALAASTGGVKLVWSKKLTSTAGRATWKREALRSHPSNPSSATPSTTTTTIRPSTTYRHHATIELATKVIDSPSRLLNVLAHEYCHLANFMISGIKDQPHGREFKAWARKVSETFAGRGVNVTTKHDYAIAFKYVWVCEGCGLEYKRHSKSIEPGRHSCGSCKGGLVQVLPVPRGGGSGGRGGGDGDGNGGGDAEAGKRSAYQVYVKTHYARVKRENPALGMGEIMVLLGKGYREEKARVLAEEAEVAEEGGKKEEVEVGEEVVEVEVWSEGTGDRDGFGESGGLGGDGDLDGVARKLDFLSFRGEGE
ncbi:hypothetical protein MMC30_006669 [Trapelia coarctata]|nr:hypothetical protein [Trapelia coarctata]